MTPDSIPSLAELVGQTTFARIPELDRQWVVEVKIVKVEAAGLWLESQAMTEHVLSHAQISAAPKTVVMFFPYQHISWIVSIGDYPSFSKKMMES